MLAACVCAASGSTTAQSLAFKLQWTQVEAPNVAQGYAYTLKVDSAAATPLQPACLAQGTGSLCTAPLQSLTTGTHTLVVTSVNGFGSASSQPLIGSPPGAPGSVTVTVTITGP